MDFYVCLPTIFFDKLTTFPRSARQMNVAEQLLHTRSAQVQQGQGGSDIPFGKPTWVWVKLEDLGDHKC